MVTSQQNNSIICKDGKPDPSGVCKPHSVGNMPYVCNMAVSRHVIEDDHPGLMILRRPLSACPSHRKESEGAPHGCWWWPRMLKRPEKSSPLPMLLGGCQVVKRDVWSYDGALVLLSLAPCTITHFNGNETTLILTHEALRFVSRCENKQGALCLTVYCPRNQPCM